MADLKIKDLEDHMKGKTRCTKCGKILVDSNFYTSNSKLNTYTGRTSLCKDCLTNLYVSFLEETNDIRLSIYKLCQLLDFVYLENIYNTSLPEKGWNKNNTIIQNGLEIWKKYIRIINSLQNYKGYAFEHGDKIDLGGKEETENNEACNEISTIKQKELTNEDLEQKVKDKQNKEDTIRIIGYDPFEYEIEEDKSKMYAKLVNMLNEDTQEDEMKISALISIIKGQNQENKINDVITSLSSDTKSIKDNIGTIKSLTDTKEKLNKSILATAKDNKLTDLWSGHKSAGSNTLSGMVKKLKEMDLQEAQVNLFDIQTSLGMLQVARLSSQAIVENLNFGDDDLLDMVKFQREKIDFYEREYSKLKEENRKLKVVCDFNSVDYSEDIFEAEYKDVLEYTEENKKLYNDKLEEFNNMVKNVLPINTNEYGDLKIKEKEEIEKQKILENVMQE